MQRTDVIGNSQHNSDQLIFQIPESPRQSIFMLAGRASHSAIALSCRGFHQDLRDMSSKMTEVTTPLFQDALALSFEESKSLSATIANLYEGIEPSPQLEQYLTLLSRLNDPLAKADQCSETLALIDVQQAQQTTRPRDDFWKLFQSEDLCSKIYWAAFSGFWYCYDLNDQHRTSWGIGNRIAQCPRLADEVTQAFNSLYSTQQFNEEYDAKLSFQMEKAMEVFASREAAFEKLSDEINGGTCVGQTETLLKYVAVHQTISPAEIELVLAANIKRIFYRQLVIEISSILEDDPQNRKMDREITAIRNIISNINGINIKIDADKFYPENIEREFIEKLNDFGGTKCSVTGRIRIKGGAGHWCFYMIDSVNERYIIYDPTLGTYTFHSVQEILSGISRCLQSRHKAIGLEVNWGEISIRRINPERVV